MKRLLICIIGLLVQSQPALSWNSVGHRVIAQIAYDHLTPHARQTFNKYNRAMNKEYRPQSFVKASVWLDGLRFYDVNWFNSMHYMDWFFTEDDSPLPATQPINALWAIKQASHSLKSVKPNHFDKGLSLRILIHIVGDIHQPLHAASRVSKAHLEGDKGGNLLKLGKNQVADNLHAYWDKGAGFLTGRTRYTPAQIKQMASKIEASILCKPEEMDIDPEHWAKQSHQFALDYAYQIKSGAVPDKKYQSMVKTLSQKQVALAGCRLAATLNQIDAALIKNIDNERTNKY